ncbi:MAG: serine hydroxymethyltransferase [Dehalococcoidia bacterium]|jgi:glycine hydroxymethyltransferase|nr:serine hydroxymethyltransferase [Dehalococcoidia bacterium]HJN58592.1 serine hydroxymethyltransferase [Dehalococcoidia bacterium]
MKSFLGKLDPQILSALQNEEKRIKEDIILIASENYPSKSVLNVTGSIFSNKYAEGYPGKRYYAGCENVDVAENIAIERAKELFHCEHVNVQVHSGTQANMAVYSALLNPGDKILGMRLDQGGHLSHGSSVNFSGKLYDFDYYGVEKETQIIDYNEVLRKAKDFKPKLIVCGASAYPRIIDFKKFKEIAKEVNAILLADVAHISGLIATGLHPSSVNVADITTTTTHKTLRGPRGAMIMCDSGYASKIDRAVFPGIQGGPFMNNIAAKAVAFKEALNPEFKTYCNQIILNSKVLAKNLQEFGFRVISGGTDNHLVLLDVTSKGCTGLEVETILRKIGIIINKNSIPYDELSPRVTSGIRLGTPAVTSRGMRESEMDIISELIDQSIRFKEDNKKLEKIKHKALSLALKFDVPGIDD